MNDSNGLDGIQSGDHKKATQQERDVQRGFMVMIVIVIGIFVTGMGAGWAMTVAVCR